LAAFHGAGKTGPPVPDKADQTQPQPHQKPQYNQPGSDNTAAVGPSRHLASEAGYPQAMSVYWQQIASAKSHHKYVTAFPPVYTGMDDPKIARQATQPPPDITKSTGKMPSLNDLYAASKDLNRIALHNKSQPDFALTEVSEAEFKQRYAAETVFVGKEFNLDKAQMQNLVERIYAFEDGGWGTHDTLSSMPQGLTDDSQKQTRLSFHPASSAMGYNQLLIKDTVTDIIQHGDAIAGRLESLAAEHPDRATVLHQKAQLVQNIHNVLSQGPLPEATKGKGKQNAFVPFSKIEKAVQALNLDGDIGPVIQSQELYNLLKYSADNKFADYVKDKTELATSNAKVYDTLTAAQKTAAINQLFALIVPAEIHPDDPTQDAPFAATKESLHKKFLTLDVQGKTSPLERDLLSTDEQQLINSRVLTIRRYGGQSGPLSVEARALLDRATSDYFGGFSADQFQPAAIELANLSGMGTAQEMLQPEHSNLPTSNFFARNGYQGNPITSRRSADELLLQIYRVMHGPNGDASRAGIAQFNAAYDSLDPKPTPLKQAKP
jgi:hypothetical protein